MSLKVCYQAKSATPCVGPAVRVYRIFRDYSESTTLPPRQ